MFVHLNCHSNHSFLAGANHIEDLVHTAANMGCPALALTDTNGLYGAVAFYQAAKSVGIHPVFGVEITSQLPSPLSPSKLNSKNISGRAIILAKNLAGFSEVCRTTTGRQVDPQFSLAEQLASLSDQVIILCPSLDLLNRIAKKRGSQNLYAELAYFPNRHILQFTRDKNLPVVATNRVFFCQPKDRETYSLLTAIRKNTTVHSIPPKDVISSNGYMKSPAQMTHIFRHIPDAIHNSLVIAEQCNIMLPIGTVNFPPFISPEEETHSSHLKRLVLTGITKLYPASIPNEVKRRLDYELKIINDLNFATYFLIVWDIVREAKKRDIATIGRGSAANSLVCRALNITDVDPIRHNLYFERFLNPERTDYPDIDIDFPSNRRDEILGYVFKKYGQDHVALISSHVHFRGRSALREVGKALGISDREINHLTSQLPHSIKISRLSDVRQAIPECHNLPLEDEPYRSMINLAQRIEGFPRHISIHCGGIVISPFPITDIIPLQKTQKGFVVTQYNMYSIEDMGLLKIDLLAQKGLAVITDTLDAIEAKNGIRPDFKQIDPTQNEKTHELICSGNTIGCFYIESPGMRNLLKKLGVRDFDMLTAASSIIRPGVVDSGMAKTFINRHNGKEPITYLHPKMGVILKDTFGVMIYQEDVIKVAHTIAGMSLGQADGLRKCMSKKRNQKDINTYRQLFLSSAITNKVKAHTALEIWRQIESFAGYAFCKAHSASFAMASYRTAYLKAYYPSEFMAAVLSNRGGFYNAMTYIEEARRMGIRILPPHINQSVNEFTAHGTFIRVGFSQVKGLKKNTAIAIIKTRQGKSYRSLINFLSRIDITEPEAEALIRCGALDGLDSSRPEMLWILKIFSKQKNSPLLASPLKIKEYTLREKLQAGLEHRNLTVSDHLLTLYDIDNTNIVSASELSRFAGRIVTLSGWLVTTKQTLTVKNELMKFLTLDDATDLFEVTLFPKIYQRFGSLFYDHGPYIVKGRVKKEGRSISVTALWANRIENQK